MLSNRYLYFIFISSAFLIYSCTEKQQKPPVQILEINTQEAAIKEARKVLGADAQIAVLGNFSEDTTKEFAAGTEINKPDKWGIQFHLLKIENNNFKDDYSTALLEGSFTGAQVKVEKLASLKYDLVYYNSLDYFIGSGGGEVFSYLIDFKNKQTFYAHLFMERGRNISLFLSENVTPEIKNFFLSVFKKDYPDIRIVNKDVDLDD